MNMLQSNSLKSINQRPIVQRVTLKVVDKVVVQSRDFTFFDEAAARPWSLETIGTQEVDNFPIIFIDNWTCQINWLRLQL